MSLAIIIPAYKQDYLERTLSSIAKQTDKDFSVYIGDDCSPYNLKNIVDRFSSTISIKYHRFEQNIGKKDLVGQWERCIKLSRNEEWIWLFSDDDTMENNCVEQFKKMAMKYSNTEIFHFNVNIIDGSDNVIHESLYPFIITSKDLYIKKLKGQLDCYVVEFIFKRSVYNQYKGFVNFDLGWGSDIATWLNFGHKYGILTIPKARINWRKSGTNISTTTSIDILSRKASALLVFLEWGEKRFNSSEIRSINKIGLLKRLSYMGVISNYSFGISYLKKYSKSDIEFLWLSSIYYILYFIKYIKNVFQRNIARRR